MKTHVSFLHIIAVGVLLSLSAPWIHAQAPFVSKSHGVAVTVPKGWDQIEGVLGSTVLKLARVSAEGAKARIAIGVEPIPAGHPLAGSFDIWEMSDDDIKSSSEGNSLVGEKVTVLAVGRSAIDGYHFVWTKASRPVPLDGTLAYEFVYEGVVAGRHFTIRLTAMGSENWLADNQPDFASLVRSLRFSRPQSSTEMDQEIQSVSHPRTAKTFADLLLEEPEGQKHSAWRDLAAAFGDTYVKVLGMVILLSIVGIIWRKIRHSATDSPPAAPPEDPNARNAPSSECSDQATAADSRLAPPPPPTA